MTFEINLRDNELHPIWNKLQRGERPTQGSRPKPQG